MDKKYVEDLRDSIRNGTPHDIALRMTEEYCKSARNDENFNMFMQLTLITLAAEINALRNETVK